MRQIKVWFWKIIAIVYDYRPSKLPNRYTDRPIAWRWDNGETDFDYPEHIKILYEWREKGKHWIIFTR